MQFYVITSNCFVVYFTLHTKSRIAFCLNTPKAVRIIVESKRFRNIKKFSSSKTLLKLAGGGCILHIPPWIRHGPTISLPGIILIGDTATGDKRAFISCIFRNGSAEKDRARSFYFQRTWFLMSVSKWGRVVAIE